MFPVEIMKFNLTSYETTLDITVAQEVKQVFTKSASPHKKKNVVYV